jgi:hypothetical protein
MSSFVTIKTGESISPNMSFFLFFFILVRSSFFSRKKGGWREQVAYGDSGGDDRKRNGREQQRSVLIARGRRGYRERKGSGPAHTARTGVWRLVRDDQVGV